MSKQNLEGPLFLPMQKISSWQKKKKKIELPILFKRKKTGEIAKREKKNSAFLYYPSNNFRC